MASRRLKTEDWSPVAQTRIYTRAAPPLEPRDEFVRLPKNSERALRPKPLNIPSRPTQSPPELKGPPPSRKESCENPRDPEIIDVAAPVTWPQRGSPALRTRRMPSPTISSQYSTRQSKISLGIIDYYMRDRTPSLYSPELPPPTPKLDPAIDKFDFGFPPTPCPSVVPTLEALPPKPASETKQGPLIPISPPLTTTTTPRQASLNKGYSLFPVIKEVTPPPRQPTITIVPQGQSRDVTPSSTISSVYRPRKESVSSSVRSRTDSLISGKNRIPLRILSSTSTPSINSHRRIVKTEVSPPESQSRWSDDTTITSPSMAPTPGPRTSFGSLLRRDSAQYPACFFEDDDDEEAPLRRKKFSWKKSNASSSINSSEHHRRSYDESDRTFGQKVMRVMLCGCAS